MEEKIFDAAIRLINTHYPSGWGGDVSVAVSNNGNKLVFKTLRELMPYHWSMVNGKAP